MNAYIWSDVRCGECFGHLTVVADEGRVSRSVAPFPSYVYCGNPTCSEHEKKYWPPRVALTAYTR